MRPGLLDQLIYIPLPDYMSRMSIFKTNLCKSPVAEDVTFKLLVEVTEGFSGADIMEICQHAAKNAIRECIVAKIKRRRRVNDGKMTQEEVDVLPTAKSGPIYHLHPLRGFHEQGLQVGDTGDRGAV